MDIKNINLNNNPLIMDSFGKMFICNDSATDNKSIIFPDGYNHDLNISFKVLFTNGHFKNNDSSSMTLNDIPVVVNKYGTLIPIPNHDINNNGLVYNTLQSNTILDMYYTNNYDGNDNPAFVVIGNPVVMSSVDYTIYADGKVGDDLIGTVKEWSLPHVPYGWIECNGQPVSRNRYPELLTLFSTHTYDGSDINVYPTRSLLRRYGVGDGSTTFQVPDYRECALVGVGSNGTFITQSTQNHDVYTLGEFKDDCFQGHEHALGGGLVNNISTTQGMGAGSQNTQIYGDPLYDTSGISWKSGYASPRVEQTTHGKQIGIKYLIKGL